jgi:hypothetical protein
MLALITPEVLRERPVGLLYPGWKRILLASLLGISTNSPALATDSVGSLCCQDIEQRVEELSAVTTSGRGVSLEVSGQLHRSVLYWSDRHEHNAYVVDPTSGGSYFTFSGDAEVNSKWETGFMLEIEIPINPSGELSQSISSFSPEPGVGAAHFYIAHEDLGSLGLGKQTEAHDHITEFDLSATDDFASPAVADWSGGFLVRRRNGNQQPIEGLTWSLLGADDIGDGAEANVVRFDTPEERKLQASLSWGMGGVSAVALRFNEMWDDFEVSGGAAFAYYAQDTRSPCREEVELDGCGTVAGSLSIKHKPSAVIATFATGFTSINPTAIPGDDYWYYAKLARVWSLSTLGPTTTYSEYFHGTRSIETQLDEVFPNGVGSAGLRANTNVYGIGVMQSLEGLEVDFYLAYRHYQVDAEFSDTMLPRLTLEPFSAVMFGSRMAF